MRTSGYPVKVESPNGLERLGYKDDWMAYHEAPRAFTTIGWINNLWVIQLLQVLPKETKDANGNSH
jgi:hypothetical protein